LEKRFDLHVSHLLSVKALKTSNPSEDGVEHLPTRKIEFTTGAIVALVKTIIAAEREGEEEDEADWVTTRRIGQLLSRLRLPRERKGKQRLRTRTATIETLLALGTAYGVQISHDAYPHLADLMVLMV
jgi:hypothetical protein